MQRKFSATKTNVYKHKGLSSTKEEKKNKHKNKIKDTEKILKNVSEKENIQNITIKDEIKTLMPGKFMAGGKWDDRG